MSKATLSQKLMRIMLVTLAMSSAAYSHADPAASVAPTVSGVQPTSLANAKYLQARKDFKTNLVIAGPSPQSYAKLPNNNNVKTIEYPSDGRMLKALLKTYNIEEGKKKPVLVYLHGGFALSENDLYYTQKFTDKGFIVLVPSYRGEDGNDGHFELLLGEVDDAKAAIEWMAKQPFTDTDNIYVFGHGVGGGMALQLAYFPDLPIKQSGSSAGLYGSDQFMKWDAPFINRNHPERVDFREFVFRSPLMKLDAMARKHTMYIGTDDSFEENAQALRDMYGNQKLLLDLQEVKGDHYSSLLIAMDKFIKKIGY